MSCQNNLKPQPQLRAPDADPPLPSSGLLLACIWHGRWRHPFPPGDIVGASRWNMRLWTPKLLNCSTIYMLSTAMDTHEDYRSNARCVLCCASTGNPWSSLARAGGPLFSSLSEICDEGSFFMLIILYVEHPSYGYHWHDIWKPENEIIPNERAPTKLNLCFNFAGLPPGNLFESLLID